MQESRHLAIARPREGDRDDDGDPIISSHSVEFREFNDEARCIPCQRLGRGCHIREGADSCIQCVLLGTPLECVFVRKVVRHERPNWFTWVELTGFSKTPYRTHPPHHSNGQAHHFQEPPRPLQYPQPYPPQGHPPETNHVERTWASYQQQAPLAPPPQPHIYNGPVPPPKRQRTDMYDGQDVFAHSRQHSLTGPPPSEFRSPHRTEYHLPEIRPHEPIPQVSRADTAISLKEERPVSAPHDRNKPLDLKPPSGPPAPLKRKLEPEPNDMILPHYCSKCEASFKTPAELKKHFARHEPQYFCNIPGCSRGKDGFTTKNDLDRHRKTMHKILSPNDRFWKCFFPDCAKTEKVWPRLDNFKAHIVRMHGSQYVAENVTRAEEWWDAQKTPMLGRSPETTHDLVAIEPKPPHEASRFGVTNLLSEPPGEHVNGRRRHLSAEGRQEAAQVREMGACLRCALLKEKCDDNRVCHRCISYSHKHFNGALICRRGSIADYLVPLIPLFQNLPQPAENTKGWNLRSFTPKLRVTTFSGLLDQPDFPEEVTKYDLHKNSFTIALFKAIDEVILAQKNDTQSHYGAEFREEVEILRHLRAVCCLIFDCVSDALRSKPTLQEKADIIEKLQRTNLELREWYDELDNAVFDWKSRHLELNHHPMKKWNLFFSICAMLVMERLTVLLTRAWAHVTEVKEDSTDDEAADTLCALLEFKFQRQAPAQHHFISMLLDERHEATSGRSSHPIVQLTATTCNSQLRDSMNFLRETKGFETWKWLYEQFGDAGADQDGSPRAKDDAMSDDSDTIRPTEGHNLRSRRSTSRNSNVAKVEEDDDSGHEQNGETSTKSEESPDSDKMEE
ncbi:hypothetical protein LTS08_004958 [Lithohypha guttulata]|nr:hypothetical protein LTS08_004958 [Lithohypha guttulata]